uniref:Uncharacterized protein n=1 Tax=Rhizophora mucronata TaxID=61149 RepID=A0A2P2Q600_RHIMU
MFHIHTLIRDLMNKFANDQKSNKKQLKNC